MRRGHALSDAEVREAIVRARTRGEVDPEMFIDALEALDGIVDAFNATPSEVFPEEIHDPLEIADAIRDGASAVEKRLEDEQETLATERAELKKARDEAEDRCRDMDQLVAESRRRAERAEHDLAEAVRNGHGLDAENARRVADQARTLEVLAKAILEAAAAPEEAVVLAKAVLGIEEPRRAKRRRALPPKTG